MNIFWLDPDLKKCAQQHCDKHVVKMITEYAQLLSASSRLSGLEQGYKLSHKGHPCTKWLLYSVDNWLCLRSLAFLLHDEYQYRYGKLRVHNAIRVIANLEVPPIPSRGITQPPQCMPIQYKDENVFKAYRKYYIFDKSKFATWKKRTPPEWYTNARIKIEELESND